MEKKEIREVKEVMLELYVAKDGCEFDNASECMEYEKQLEFDELWATILNKRLKVADGYAPFDGEEYYEQHFYKWVYVETEAEANAIENLAYGFCVPFPEWICIESYGAGAENDIYIRPLTPSIEYATTLLNLLGYDVTITKREEV